jgi:hypothetical protein
VSCYDSAFGGWYMNGCYYKLSNPQPPTSDVVWLGRPPGGAAYDARCFSITVTGPSWPGTLALPWPVWLANPPPKGPGPTPGQVAQLAIAKLVMRGPTNGIAPPVGSYAVVGMPVWLWTTDDPLYTHWGPQTQSAGVGGVNVSATATATQIEWHMGDGNTKVCANPGTQYVAGTTAGAVSPTCSYTYTTTSAAAPNQQFSIFGVTTWSITWSGGGQTGAQTLTAQSLPVQLKVESAQALTAPK